MIDFKKEAAPSNELDAAIRTSNAVLKKAKSVKRRRKERAPRNEAERVYREAYKGFIATLPADDRARLRKPLLKPQADSARVSRVEFSGSPDGNLGSKNGAPLQSQFAETYSDDDAVEHSPTDKEQSMITLRLAALRIITGQDKRPMRVIGKEIGVTAGGVSNAKRELLVRLGCGQIYENMAHRQRLSKARKAVVAERKAA